MQNAKLTTTTMAELYSSASLVHHHIHMKLVMVAVKLYEMKEEQLAVTAYERAQAELDLARTYAMKAANRGVQSPALDSLSAPITSAENDSSSRTV